MAKYYVYGLARPDGQVFYVGKGTGARIYKHEVDARLGRNASRYQVIRAIWQAGGEVVRVMFLETDEETAAYSKERALIRLLGTVLTNTAGNPAARPRTVSPGRARHAAGFIREVRKDVWRVQVSVGGREDRRRASATVWGARRMAQQRYNELVRELKSGPPDPATTHTVQQAIDAWWKEETRTKDAAALAKQTASRLAVATAFGSLPIARLDLATWLAVERHWLQTLRPGTITKRRTLLRAALKHAQQLGWVRADPLEWLPSVRWMRAQARLPQE